MQPILKTTDYSNLYHFLVALQLTTEQINSARQSDTVQSVFIWSPETHSSLLDSIGKLEVVTRHANLLNIRLVLSAASDVTLRNWGQQLGWTVLWANPALDEVAPTLVDAPEYFNCVAS